MARQSDEMQKLKRKLANVQRENDLLKEKVKRLENNFSIELFSALEAIRGEYNTLLNLLPLRSKRVIQIVQKLFSSAVARTGIEPMFHSNFTS
jgi:hypothetical protein